MFDVDVEIRPLVNFINNLEGVKTYGSCQGHDDGGKSGDWLYPYIKFKCINNRSLGLIAGIENAYANLDSLQKLNNFNPSELYQPELKAMWTTEVVSNIDYNSIENTEDDAYALFVLRADSSSYNKPSEVYEDFPTIIKWYEMQMVSK
tara:strand:+ start:1107 stop:1550 length:444 start_codon:yes stop_codon:yes gene_type:complete